MYALKDKTAVLFVRPRGWHLDEAHVTVNGRVASGSLFDFGLYFFHNVHTLLQKGTRPYFYLPKLEDYLEARLWNDVFKAAQSYFGVPIGTIRATVLLETITAAFQMEELLYELKDHSLGLNWSVRLLPMARSAATLLTLCPLSAAGGTTFFRI